MGKATVESSRKLDAHYWARSQIRPLIAPLAELFRRAGGRLQPGQKAQEIGLVTLSWHWTSNNSSAGEIIWAVQKTNGDKAQTLLLLFNSTVRGVSHPRRQEVALSWKTPAGYDAQRPVFLCPFCGRRCRYLCSAYPGRQGGPYVGEFACRTCAGLCYAAQLEYRSQMMKHFDAMLRLSDLAQRSPERLSEAHVEKAQRAGQECLARMDNLLRPGRRSQEPAEPPIPEARREWVEVPPSLYAPPKKRGRPNGKKARWQARECAKIVRQAGRDAKPKRSPGRPKGHRAYNVTARVSAGCAGRVGAGEGYCVGCRAVRIIADAASFTASNGRAGVKGKCTECRRGLCRMGASVAT